MGMKTIQKPKRMWQKKKDYNKKKLIRKIQRRNKTSFDDGKDTPYSDLKTNRPIIIGDGLIAAITPKPKGYKNGKDRFDIGSDVKVDRNGTPITKDSLVMYGTPEQITNSNQLWEYPKELEDVVVTPKGSYPNIQSYIAATHGSAYDQQAALPLIQLVDPTGITNYPTAWREIKNFYNNPSLNSAVETGAGIWSALPVVGKYGRLLKGAKYLNLPGFIFNKYTNKSLRNIIKGFDEALYGSNGFVSDKTAKTISNIFQNTTRGLSRLYENAPDLLSKDMLYKIATNTEGEPNPFYLGGGYYNGSYIYNNNVNKGKSKYTDDNIGDRDLVNLLINGKSKNIQKLENPNPYILDGTVIPYDQYEGFILPSTENGTYKLNKKYKDLFDKYIENDNTFSANQLNLPENPNMKKQILDQVRHFRIKPKRDKSGKYTMEPSKVWDFNGTTNIFGDRLERLIKNKGGSPFILKQKEIPIEFVDGYAPENNIFENTVTHNSGKDIHIKKANRGKFTEAANEHNMGVQEFARQVLSAPKGKYSSTLRKRANFARNFAH